MMTEIVELKLDVSQILKMTNGDIGKAFFDMIRDTSVSRCLKWHGEKGLDDWSVLEWAGAMCGEAGEAANVAKKLIREYHGMQNSPQNIFGDPLPEAIQNRLSVEELREKLGQEIADTFLYLILLAAKENIDLYPVIAETFNKKSKEYGFPERLPFKRALSSL